MAPFSLQRQKSAGFTIIELVIVVVVIAIIATITIVAYGQITGSVKTETIQQDLRQAASVIESKKQNEGSYPSSIESLGLKASSGISYEYLYDAYARTFCLQATNGTLLYYIVTKGGPTQGLCPGFLGATKLSAGGAHACSLMTRIPYCWGAGGGGRLGNTGTADVLIPSPVTTSGVLAGKTVSGLFGGNTHTCAIADGRAYCWGTGANGRLGRNSTSSATSPVAVTASGVLSGKTVTAMSGGYTSTCAIADGQAYCWGGNANGQLGNNSTTDSLVPVAVDASGVLSGKTVTAIAAGAFHACAIADGQPYCWGRNGAYGRLGNNATSDDALDAPVGPVAVDTSGVLAGKTVTSIAMDSTSVGAHTCVIADGRAYCWGTGANGRLGTGSTADSLVPAAVTTSGILAGKTITAIAAGGLFTCAMADGKAYCWGYNNVGQLGRNNTSSSSSPVAVDITGVLAGKRVTEISAGSAYACAVADQQVFCWGSGANGRLGNNSTTQYLVPVAAVMP